MAGSGDERAASPEGQSHLRASHAGENNMNGGGGGKDGSSDRRFQVRIALIGVAGTVLAAVVGAVIGLHPWSSGSSTPSPSALGVPSPSVQTSVSSAFAPLAGNVFVKYQDGTDATAQLSGEVTDAVSGEVAKLYAEQFPFTSPPSPLDSVALDPSGATAQYAFQVTPTLATRYTVEVFRNSAATAPLASSATSFDMGPGHEGGRLYEGRSGNRVVIFGVDVDRNDPSGDGEVIFHGQWKGQR